MSVSALTRRYAKALVEIGVEQKAVESYGDELASVKDVLAGDQLLRQLHDSPTLDEATQTLRYPRELSLSVLELLRAQGYLRRDDGRYRTTRHWDRAAVRYLRRKHLLHT